MAWIFKMWRNQRRVKRRRMPRKRMSRSRKRKMMARMGKVVAIRSVAWITHDIFWVWKKGASSQGFDSDHESVIVTLFTFRVDLPKNELVRQAFQIVMNQVPLKRAWLDHNIVVGVAFLKEQVSSSVMILKSWVMGTPCLWCVKGWSFIDSFPTK